MQQDLFDPEPAARLLLNARARGARIAEIPAPCRPAGALQALAIQRRVAELSGQPTGGWKAAMPSAARPLLFGPIFAPSIVREGPFRIAGAGPLQKVEPEMAFVLARDLHPRETPYTDEEIRAAVGEVRLALEIIGPRYEDPKAVSYPELLADNVANEGVYVGPVVQDPWRRSLASFPVVVRTASGVIVRKDGRHQDGDPARPLQWLANNLSCTGMSLRAGQLVITGSYCGIVEIPVGEAVTFDCGDAGELTLLLQSRPRHE